MPQYMLSIVQPDGPPPAPEVLGPIMQDVAAFLAETKEKGSWVFNGGLTPPSSATVVRVKNDALLLTDGPFSEGKEHIGGFVVVRADDLDGALVWGEKLARAVTLPIEVRAFAHSG